MQESLLSILIATVVVPGLPRSPTAVLFFLWSRDVLELPSSVLTDEETRYQHLEECFVLSYHLSWLLWEHCIPQEAEWVFLNRVDLVWYLLILFHSIKPTYHYGQLIYKSVINPSEKSHMVIKISLPIVTRQTFIFFHNKRLQIVYILYCPYYYYHLSLLKFCPLFLKLSCLIERSRFIAYSPKPQTTTWRLSINWQIHARKNSCCT